MADPLPWEVDCRAVRSLQDSEADFLFVDCREPHEHDLVKIAGATLVPLGQTPQRLAEFEPFRDRPIIVHCHHGGRSLRAAQWLRQNGFPTAQSMAGGIHRWAEEIEPGMLKY